MSLSEGLVGHWKFADDCDDYSSVGHSSANHGVVVGAVGPDGKPNTAAQFDGRQSHIEVPVHPSLDFGADDFSIAVWVHTEKDLDDVVGDIVSKYDAQKRKGFNFNVISHPGVTSSHANDRNIHFGIDNGRIDSRWTDCGRLGNALHIAALAVFDDNLYAGTFETSRNEAGHVFRYEGGDKWTDCGSPAPCNMVSSLAVYDRVLYCGVTCYKAAGSVLPDSPNTHPGGKILRYEGEKRWTDCGQIDDGDGVHCLIVFRGTLYAAPLYEHGVLAYRGGKKWEPVGPDARITCLGYWNGHLYGLTSGMDAVYRMKTHGQWENLGRPDGTRQLYSFAVYQGKPHIGTWPCADVFRYDNGTAWTKIGTPGYSKEVMGMAVYNGKLYAGVLPMAEVYRYEHDTLWTRTGTVDNTPDRPLRRAWSMAVYDGRLFCGALPSGHVMSLEAGKLATCDNPLEPGWRHLAAVQKSGRLRIVVEGEVVSERCAEDIDVTNEESLKIGFGVHDYFCGCMSDLRIYDRALTLPEVAALAGRTQ